MEKTNTEFKSGKIGKLILKYSIPSMISMLFMAAYNLVDQIFISQGVGYLGNAATNIVFPMAQIAIGIGALFGDGSAAFINLKRGGGEEKEAQIGMKAAAAASLVLGLAASVIASVFLTPICAATGATDAIMPYALDYGRIIAFGLVFSVFNTCSAAIIRADGAPGFSMAGIVAGTAINLIGDPLTIFVWGMGMKGAAYATVLGQAVNSVMNMIYLLRRIRGFRTDGIRFGEIRKSLRRIAYLGMSSFTSNIAMVIGLFIQNKMFIYYGALSVYGAEIPLAAFGVAMKISMLMQSLVNGLVAGSQPLLSFNYGAKSYERVKRIINCDLAVTFLILLGTTVIFQLFPVQLLSIFGIYEGEYLRFGMMCLRVSQAMLAIETFQMNAIPILQSMGHALTATVFVMLRQLVLSVLGFWIFGNIYGVEGLLYSGPFISIAMACVAVITLLVLRNKLNRMIYARDTNKTER